jgi:hypothetical protein
MILPLDSRTRPACSTSGMWATRSVGMHSSQVSSSRSRAGNPASNATCGVPWYQTCSIWTSPLGGQVGHLDAHHWDAGGQVHHRDATDLLVDQHPHPPPALDQRQEPVQHPRDGAKHGGILALLGPLAALGVRLLPVPPTPDREREPSEADRQGRVEHRCRRQVRPAGLRIRVVHPGRFRHRARPHQRQHNDRRKRPRPRWRTPEGRSISRLYGGRFAPRGRGLLCLQARRLPTREGCVPCLEWPPISVQLNAPRGGVGTAAPSGALRAVSGRGRVGALCPHPGCRLRAGLRPTWRSSAVVWLGGWCRGCAGWWRSCRARRRG